MWKKLNTPVLMILEIDYCLPLALKLRIVQMKCRFIPGKRHLTGSVRARKLSWATMRNIKQNLFFAFIYNTLGVPIAAGVLYPWFSIVLSPVIAAAAMSFSSVSVVTNALRLRAVRVERY